MEKLKVKLWFERNMILILCFVSLLFIVVFIYKFWEFKSKIGFTPDESVIKNNIVVTDNVYGLEELPTFKYEDFNSEKMEEIDKKYSTPFLAGTLMCRMLTMNDEGIESPIFDVGRDERCLNYKKYSDTRPLDVVYLGNMSMDKNKYVLIGQKVSDVNENILILHYLVPAPSKWTVESLKSFERDYLDFGILPAISFDSCTSGDKLYDVCRQYDQETKYALTRFVKDGSLDKLLSKKMLHPVRFSW